MDSSLLLWLGIFALACGLLGTSECEFDFWLCFLVGFVRGMNDRSAGMGGSMSIRLLVLPVAAVPTLALTDCLQDKNNVKGAIIIISMCTIDSLICAYID